MNYLDALESELTRAGIPGRRRARILTEFADHLHENPEAELGAPRELACQFADELGTQLARSAAYRAFGILAVAATVLVVMFLKGGRMWGGWVGYGSHPTSAYMPSWWVPLMVVWFISAQVALAAGALALLRTWRLRQQHVITAADAAILNRRAALGLAAGAVTMLVLPATDLMLARPLIYRLPGGGIERAADQWHSLFAETPTSWWGYVAIIGGPLLIVAMVSTIPSVLAAARLRPRQEGVAGDLTLDLGVQNTVDPAVHRAHAERRDRPRDAGDRHRLEQSGRWARPRSARRQSVHDRVHRPRRLPGSTNHQLAIVEWCRHLGQRRKEPFTASPPRAGDSATSPPSHWTDRVRFVAI